MKSKPILINSCVLIILTVLSASSFADVYRVALDGDNTTGESWAKAYTDIETAIDAASGGDEIWVKQGTYYLTGTILVNKAVEILGGFNGTEGQRQDRNWQLNVTRVDGLDSYRCFTITRDATIDGFAGISNGYADDIGGGIYANNCNAVITNCYIEGNSAQNLGGGIALEGTYDITISNCILISNTTTATGSKGGGIYCKGQDDEHRGESIITNCIITGNTAGAEGNIGTGGGVYCDIYSAPTLRNCTIAGNKAGAGESSGGGVYVDPQYCYPIIMNSILWSNLGFSGVADIYSFYNEADEGSDPNHLKLGYNNFGEMPPEYDLWNHVGNISVDPNFVNFEPPTAGDPGTGYASDFRLNAISPVIDQGVVSYQGVSAPADDIEGKPRPQDEEYDMGAHEYLLPDRFCDTNFDGRVDEDDMLVLSANWLADCTLLGWCQGSDYNRSGEVNIIDFSILSGEWYLGMTTVPDVVGMTEPNAMTDLADVNLTGTATHEYSDTIAIGLVISSDPAAGTSVPYESSVDIVISLGPILDVEVPDVLNMTEPDATTALIDAGLLKDVVTHEYSEIVPVDLVISSDPVAGTSVPYESSVNLVISLGHAPVDVPNVLNMTVTDAGDELTAVGLSIGTVTTEYNDTVADGLVISSDPIAGTVVPYGSSVDLVVSLGVEPTKVGYWRMDDNEPNTMVLDSSIYNNSGTAQRNTSLLSVAGVVDQALSFDGVGDYIQIADSVSLNPSEEVTVCGWFYFNDASENVGLIWKDSYNYALNTYSDGVHFTVWNPANVPSAASFSTSLLESGWNFIAGVFDGTNSKLYLNGAPIGSIGASITGGIRDQAGDLYIGQRPDGNGEEYFDGLIDEVKIFGKALSENEVIELYDEGGI